jgi:hypothetical protein
VGDLRSGTTKRGLNKKSAHSFLCKSDFRSRDSYGFRENVCRQRILKFRRREWKGIEGYLTPDWVSLKTHNHNMHPSPIDHHRHDVNNITALFTSGDQCN